MTNRQFLQQRLRRGLFPFVPVVAGYSWTFYFSRQGASDRLQDLVTGGAIMIAMAVVQFHIVRARFTCPACKANLWHIHRRLQSVPLACPHCGLDMDKPYRER
jgi:predicted RNA-binding Zn-ribbon protein involved in translation (DUF1610 family)